LGDSGLTTPLSMAYKKKVKMCLEKKLTEPVITELVKNFLLQKTDGNWHEDKVREAGLHGHGADIVLVGGKRNSEYFYIECKGKSYAKSAGSINKEGWLNALGQLITRMNTKRIIEKGKYKGKVNRSYKYGMGLYWIGAKVALRRIPFEAAKVLNLYVFSVSDDGVVKQWSPRDFGKEHMDSEFTE